MVADVYSSSIVLRSTYAYSNSHLASPRPTTPTHSLQKRIAYVYRAKVPSKATGSRVRVIWGKVTRPHGNSGAVKSKFRSNLPPHSFGAICRVVSCFSRGFLPPDMGSSLMLVIIPADAVPFDDLISGRFRWRWIGG